mgnify:CR=1 FL=1
MLGQRSSRFQQVPDIHHLLGQCPAVPDIFQHMQCAGSKVQRIPAIPDIHHLLGKRPAVPDIGIWAGFGLIPTFSSICNVLGHRSSRFQQVPDIIADSIMIASPFQIFSKSMSGFWRDLVKSRHNPTLFTQQEPNKIQQKPDNARQSPARTQQNPAITQQNPAFITQQNPAF